jgi:hypothetical protein
VVEQLTVRWPSGEVQVVEAVAINGTVTVIEPLPTGTSTYEGHEELSVYPVPARDRIHFKGTLPADGTAYRVLDRTGRVVQEGRITGASVAIDRLTPGLYALQVGADRSFDRRIIKE